METSGNLIEPLFERIEEYGKTSYVLFKLKALEKATGLVSSVVSRGTVLLTFSFAVIVLSIAAALCLGDYFGKTYYGFLCIGGFYLVLGIILHFFMRQWIKKTVMNSILSKMLQ
jgi:hypothetical protein